MNGLSTLGHTGGDVVTSPKLSRLVLPATLLATMLSMLSPVLGQPGWVKDCLKGAEKLSYPDNVSAVFLCQSAEFSYLNANRVDTRYRRCVKVLSPAGLSDAVLQVTLNECTRLSGLKGWLIRPGGATIDLDKKYVLEKGVGAPGYYLQSTLLAAAFPDINSGDVVAFEYGVESETPFDNTLQSFEVQRDMPVLYARLEVEIPSDWKLNWSTHLIETPKPDSSHGRYAWEIRNLAPRLQEPYMPPWTNASRGISFMGSIASAGPHAGFADWTEAATSAEPIVERGVVLGDSVRNTTLRLTAGLTSLSAKTAAIAKFVQDQIRYVAVEIGPGRFEPRRADSTLARKFGDCKDKAALMRSMLKVVNIPSIAVLISVDRTVADQLPNPFQFDHCIVAVSRRELDSTIDVSAATDDGWTYFDPTNESVPFGRVPIYLAGATGLLLSPGDGRLVILPRVAPEQYASDIHCNARLSPNGHVDAKVTIISRRLAADDERLNLTEISTKDRLEELEHKFSRQMTRPTISNYQWKSEADSTWEQFSLSGENILVEAGNLKLLKVDLFDTAAGPSVPHNRVHPLYFGLPRTITTTIAFTLPGGWVVDRPPAEFVGQCSAASEEGSIEIQDSIVTFHSTAVYQGGVLPPEAFTSAKNFITAVNSVDGLVLSLKSK